MSEHAQLLAGLDALQSRVILDARHRYKVDGKYGATGTTTAIKALAAPALTRWMVKSQATGTAKAAYENPPYPNEPIEAYVARLERLAAEQLEHEKLSDEAARVGTQVHALVQHAIEGMLGKVTPSPDVEEEALFRFAGWRRWAVDAGLKPLASEARLYHSQHDYAGTLDILAVVGGQLAVVDIKPTSNIYVERKLQLSAYRKALETIPGCTQTLGFINVLPRDGGSISMIEVDPPGPQLDASFDAFLHCLALHRFQAEHDKRARKERAA